MQNYTAKPAAQVMDQCGWLPPGTSVVKVAVAGEGNMNLVERVTLSDGTSVILKRAHPWVEKFPDIAAPIERAAVEAAFNAAIADTLVAEAMPQHLGFDQALAANLFEDLGEGLDGSDVYRTGDLNPSDLTAIAAWLRELHALAPPEDLRLQNDAMRALNAIHIFDFPLERANGFDLDAITPGLQGAGDRLKADDQFRAHVEKLEAVYLAAPSGVLLHGDMYPASWLTTEHGLRIIDSEFCWIGPAAWDLGILAAHLMLAGLSDDRIESLFVGYGLPIDRDLANRFSGVEIMRRLIGVAQLPLNLDLRTKDRLLQRARQLVVSGK